MANLYSEEDKKTEQPNLYSEAAQTATYIDEAGNKQTGVVQPSYWDKARNSYQEMYDAQVQSNNTAAANAAARARETTDQQIRAMEQQYAGTNKELYRNYMNQQRVLPQQLAAEGYNGGMSESARLRLDSAYQEALNNNQRAKAADRAGLDAAYTQAQYEAQAAADAANANALQQKYAYLSELEANQYQTEQAQLAERAQNLAAMGDFSGYLDLGYTQDEVDYMTRIYLQQNPGMLSLWIQAHPEEAARLGIRTASRRGSGGTAQDGYTTAEYLAAYNKAMDPKTGDLAAAYKIAKDIKNATDYNDVQNQYWAGVAG